MTWILGLGGSRHDWAACLLGPDQQLVAIDEERVTRKKYGIGSDLLAAESRKYVLQSKGLSAQEVDLVVACDLVPTSYYFPYRDRVKIIGHHLAHAYSALIPSPFEEAAVLVVDNAGSCLRTNEHGDKVVETISYGIGKGTEVTIFRQVEGVDRDFVGYGFCTNNSLGYFYRTISIQLGLCYKSPQHGIFSEDGKTMGLASYGTDRYVDEYRKFVKLGSEGQIIIDAASGKIEQYTHQLLQRGDANFQVKADIAFAAQTVLEEAMLHAAKYLRQTTGLKNLVMSGGVALNCVANGRILQEAGFERIYIQPAAGDNGVALGCAFYGNHVLLKSGSQERQPLHNTYLGRKYQESQIQAALGEAADKLSWSKSEHLAKIVAQLIADGQVIALYQGGTEFGPRALGNRSILADPRQKTMRERLNLEIKNREWFRPFAPVVLQSRVREYFDLQDDSPFMLLVARVIRPELIPAVTHVDGTARVQTITKQVNPFYYSVVEEFEKLTGVPVLVNTSFNNAGEPIVETPSDAIRAFLAMNLDALVLENYLVTKSHL